MGKKIIIGITEIANFINDYAIALRTAGYEVGTIVCGSNKYYIGNQYSYKIQEDIPKWISRIKYVRGAVKKYGIISNRQHSFFLFCLGIMFLFMFGKLLICLCIWICLY